MLRSFPYNEDELQYYVCNVMTPQLQITLRLSVVSSGFFYPRRKSRRKLNFGGMFLVVRVSGT